MSHIYQDEAMQDTLDCFQVYASSLAYLLHSSSEEDKRQAFDRVIDQAIAEFEKLRPVSPF